jgi:late competence protein required for DNA uptake (superfamily II DNA/RNA helicase)
LNHTRTLFNGIGASRDFTTAFGRSRFRRTAQVWSSKHLIPVLLFVPRIQTCEQLHREIKETSMIQTIEAVNGGYRFMPGVSQMLWW